MSLLSAVTVFTILIAYTEVSCQSDFRAVAAPGCRKHASLRAPASCLHVNTGRAALRCCSETQCVSFCSGSHDLVNFLTATTTCQANGMRLCNRYEAASDICCDTGCGFDSHQMWIDEDCTPQEGHFMVDGCATYNPVSERPLATRCGLTESAANASGVPIQWAATRCCSYEGETCASFCSANAVSFEEASQICASAGRRLCTTEELLATGGANNLCCNTGCRGNDMLVWTRNPCSNEPIDVFILMGQSNMAGRGALNTSEMAQESVLRFNPDGLFWEPAKDPIHKGESDKARVGPALTFATTLRDSLLYNLEGRIGLVPTAVGGTNLHFDWNPDEVQLYTRMRGIAEAALAQPGARLAGFLWQQGESDARSTTNAAAYKANFIKFIRRLRNDFQAYNAPFIAGTLPDFLAAENAAWTVTNVNAVNNAIRTVGSEPGVQPYGFADSSDLTFNSPSDRIHFNRASAKELGRRHAAAFLEVTSGK